MNMHFFRNLFLLAAICCLHSISVYSQSDRTGSAEKWTALGVKLDWQSFGITEGHHGHRYIFRKGNAGPMFSFYRNSSAHFAYGFDLGLSYGMVGTTDYPTTVGWMTWFNTMRGNATWLFGKPDQAFRIYLHSGFHLKQGNHTVYTSIPAGLGGRLAFRHVPAMLTAELNYGIGASSKIENSSIAAIGFAVRLNGHQGQSSKTVRTERAAAKNSPCKDSDFDGVPDEADKCPLMAGSSANAGCPATDRDGDGLIDEKDNCPDVPGKPENRGCPDLDSDGDGVTDQKDQCPQTAGPVTNMGCPVTDRDHDGVDDAKDKCPDISGVVSQDGCPLPEKENLPPGMERITGSNGKDTLLMHLYFDFDKYDLDMSFAALYELKEFLRKDTGWKCQLTGHTDLEGSEEYNLNLSRKRVETSRNFLLSYGIAAERMTTNYQGRRSPVINSYDKNLAWRNRRVEVRVFK